MSDKTGWGVRCYPEVDCVNGQLVLTGGQSLKTFYNDVWRSADGVGWELVTDDVPWNDRANHLVTVFDGS